MQYVIVTSLMHTSNETGEQPHFTLSIKLALYRLLIKSSMCTCFNGGVVLTQNYQHACLKFFMRLKTWYIFKVSAALKQAVLHNGDAYVEISTCVYMNKVNIILRMTACMVDSD